MTQSPFTSLFPGRIASDLRTCWFPVFLFAVLILVVYYPALFAGYVWDDLLTLNDPRVQNVVGFPGLWLDISHPINGDYWPVTYTSHWIEFRLWGMHPLGYHATNIVLHFANTLILFYLLRRMQMSGALLVALLFSIHPVQISSVAWVVERKDLLTTLFYLLAFGAWLRFEDRSTLPRYGLALLCFTLAMLSKSMSVTWPVAVLIYGWYRTGRVGWRLVVKLLPFFSIGLLLAFWGSIFVPSPERMKLELLQKVILAGKNQVFYAGKLLWPVEHFPLYPRWQLNPTLWTEYVCPVSVVLVFLVLWMLRHRTGRGLFAAMAFYAVTLSPILGLVVWSLLTKTVAQDHYQYVSSVGPFLLFAYAAERLCSRRWVYALLLFCVLTPCVVFSQRHVRLYQNAETLFRASYEKYPTIDYAAVYYAVGLSENGKHQEALVVLDKILVLYPQVAEFWATKGAEHLWLGQTAEGIQAYQRAYALNPIEVGSLSEIATALLYDDAPNLDAMIPQLEEAYQRASQDIRLAGCLATALSLNPRRVAEGQKMFEAILRRVPPAGVPPVPLYYYGKLLLSQSEAKRALSYMRMAQQRARRPVVSWQESIAQAQKQAMPIGNWK